MIEKILLADSGTGHSEEMLKVLLEIPSIQDASVTVLHVVSPQISADEMTEKWEEGGKMLGEAVQRLGLKPDRVTAMLREGDPKDVVCRVADEVDTDLIVMGSRGLKRLQSILENSVSQYVFQLASRPMLLVKDDIYVKKIRRILVAVDQSNTAQQCLDLAIAFAKDINGSELVLVHTTPDLKRNPQELFAGHPEDDPVLKEAVAKAKPYDIKVRCEAPAGKPGQRICQLAEDLKVDLLMLGSPERRPSIAQSMPDLDRLLGRSLSDYVRVYADCPVMLVRQPDV
jgi:nucleotide-binding universal stress UspA family protein